MASASTTEITAFESQSDPYKSLQEPRNIESHVKVTIFFFCCLVPSNAGLVWNRKGGLIIKRKKANLLIFYGCLVLLYRLHVSVSLGLSIGFHFSQLEVIKSGLDMETAEKL